MTFSKGEPRPWDVGADARVRGGTVSSKAKQDGDTSAALRRATKEVQRDRVREGRQVVIAGCGTGQARKARELEGELTLLRQALADKAFLPAKMYAYRMMQLHLRRGLLPESVKRVPLQRRRRKIWYYADRLCHVCVRGDGANTNRDTVSPDVVKEMHCEHHQSQASRMHEAEARAAEVESASQTQARNPLWMFVMSCDRS